MGKGSCPACGSENTIRFAMAFQSGITTGASAHGGKSVQQSEISKATAPPVEPNFNSGVYGVLGLFGLVFVYVAYQFNFILGLFALVGGGIALVGAYQHEAKNYRANLETYKALRVTWERSWLCQRCGAKFQV